MHEWSQPPQPLVHSLVKPFHQTERFQHSTMIESTLSRVVQQLVNLLNKSSSRHRTVTVSTPFSSHSSDRSDSSLSV